ncbi:MAG TPA: Na+/H+ antiporter NhaA [Thiothrix sp.]|nr:Na+/H+ antiporter NhaA [Thiothrix sp.]
MQKLKLFFSNESASGILLVIAAILAMSAANSPFKEYYDMLLNVPVQFSVAEFVINKPILLWVNDGLMAIFFLMVGLEIKREVFQGQLSDPRKIVLPVAAAIGGIAVPSLIYAALNWHDAQSLQGWAIPAATDIAFALGVLSLLGKRVPVALKLFLLTLAIVDDLGAIIIIALFYSQDLSIISMIIAGGAALGLAILNRSKVYIMTPYLLFGAIMWTAVLKSGVHATLAGVIIAFFIPLSKPAGEKHSLAEQLEHDLHAGVAFFILPLFAFMNAGISFVGLTLDSFIGSVPVGIALGLLLGKPIGVMFFSWLMVQLRLARLPDGVNWSYLFGVSMLAGVGFTMSLFISSLAFDQSANDFIANDRIGIFFGSTLSAVLGYFYLNRVLPK